MSQLTVSRVAEQVGVSPDTLRYYEKIGLMPETERSASGYRLYGDGAVERLGFIKRAQRFGLRLEAIGQLLDIRQRGLCACGRTRRCRKTESPSWTRRCPLRPAFATTSAR